MPLQQTSGNVTQDAYGGGVAAVPVYVEDVMSTFLYTGNGSTQTITNGIDLAGKGGLVWIKPRNQTGTDHWLQTSNLGYTNSLKTNSTSQLVSGINIVSSVSATGFTDAAAWPSGWDIVSWTLKKQPKFFDVVTYTGNGVARTIPHSLGSVPGCIIVKCTSSNSTNWAVYHTALGATSYAFLNTTAASSSTGSQYYWDNTAPTSTVFSIGRDNGTTTDVNSAGETYVAYLFAHNAGGFGLTGTDNVISCDTFHTSSGGTASVTLGYEPQWLLIKPSSGGGNWQIIDTMRGFSMTQDAFLYPNTSGAETTGNIVYPTATGFYAMPGLGANTDFIYIAIRRGPMKTPTSGTKVFAPTVGLDGTSPISTGFPVDMFFDADRVGNSGNTSVGSRLTGNQNVLITSSTSAEVSAISSGACWQNNTGYTPFVFGSSTGVQYAFRRAPGTFDEVCYTGDGTSNRNVPHNLGVAPELVVIKIRSGSVGSWLTTTNFGATTASELYLDSTGAQVGGAPQTYANLTLGGKPTASNLVFGYPYGLVNTSGYTYVAYLWATNPGVTKVGTYTGNGATQTINCGFTGGSRFVLIKAANATSGWWVYDTARGMTTLTDPYLQLNSTAAETATLGSVTTVTTGFAVNETILAGINTNGTNYVFLSYA